jgi:hypothetical protein
MQLWRRHAAWIYVRRLSPQEHANDEHQNKHQGKHEPGSGAKEYDYDETISRSEEAERQAEIHTGERIACPVAETYNCDKYFNTQQHADRHAETHRSRVACSVAEEYNCEIMFARQSDADKHAKVHTEDAKIRIPRPSWVCTVPMCSRAVSQDPMSQGWMRRHMAKQKARGHLKGLEKHPEPVQSLLEPIEQDIYGPDVENATIDEMQDEVEVVESGNDHNSMLKLLENGRIEDTL